jgi:hypothetical protein
MKRPAEQHKTDSVWQQGLKDGNGADVSGFS